MANKKIKACTREKITPNLFLVLARQFRLSASYLRSMYIMKGTLDITYVESTNKLSKNSKGEILKKQ